MATWNKNKVNATDVNGGNEFSDGDGVKANDINKIFESGLYTQDVVNNISIGNVTTGASGTNASANVTYGADGYPKINLTIPRGEKGNTGSSQTTFAKLYEGYVTSSTTISNDNYTTLFIKFINENYSCYFSDFFSENGVFTQRYLQFDGDEFYQIMLSYRIDISSTSITITRNQGNKQPIYPNSGSNENISLSVIVYGLK